MIINDRIRDILIIIMAILWLFTLYACWAGALSRSNQLVFYGMMAGAFIVVIFYLLGAVTNEKISIPVLTFPIILNIVIWIIAFTMAYMTKSRKMDFILGMHPGMLTLIVIYWIGSMICTSLSLGLWFDKYYLPEENWQKFLKEVSQLKKCTRKAG
jgi:hypothetical protein